MSEPESVPAALSPASDTVGPATDGPVDVGERDIVFNCPHCQGELVVDREGAGMTFNCPHCGGRVTVPPHLPKASESSMGEGKPKEGDASGSSGGAMRLPGKRTTRITYDFSGKADDEVKKRVDELKYQLKENQSQTTEMRGHLNRAVIEMNRLQLKLQKLQDRGSEIEQELIAAKSHIEKS